MQANFSAKLIANAMFGLAYLARESHVSETFMILWDMFWGHSKLLYLIVKHFSHKLTRVYHQSGMSKMDFSNN